ncbi:MAG: type II toxin-antitoxin system VapC family toxin [Candidatus Dormibacteria bacterium]
MVVIDASATIELLLNTTRAPAVIQATAGQRPSAPDLISIEVASTIRRLVRRGELTDERGAEAIADLGAMPLRLLPMRGLLEVVWSLRHNLSAYDAAYVALARALRCPLITGDGRLARAPGLGVPTISA